MIRKRFLVTGLIEVGPHIRIILYPDEPVKPKKIFNLMDIAMSGDPTEMQQEAIINGILSNNPPTVYVSVDEMKNHNIKLSDHVNISIEVEK